MSVKKLVKIIFYQQQIEKKRRDRINSSLAELRQLVPAALRKQVSLFNKMLPHAQ